MYDCILPQFDEENLPIYIMPQPKARQVAYFDVEEPNKSNKNGSNLLFQFPMPSSRTRNKLRCMSCLLAFAQLYQVFLIHSDGKRKDDKEQIVPNQNADKDDSDDSECNFFDNMPLMNLLLADIR